MKFCSIYLHQRILLTFTSLKVLAIQFIRVLMRDEKEERKKQASMYIYMYNNCISVFPSSDVQSCLQRNTIRLCMYIYGNVTCS